MKTKQTAADRIHALPCWNGSIEIAPLSGGLSNENYVVADRSGRHVVRFGADFPFHHVFRDREVMVARAAFEAGFGPRVEYAEPGVMVTQFLGAKTFGPEDVRANATRIGKLLRQFHEIMPGKVTGPAFMFWVFHVIRDYAQGLAAAKSRYVPQLSRLLAENTALEMAQVPMRIVFGHHDLLPANFLDDGQKLWLIDFEYAGFGTPMFDLAGAASNAQMTDMESAQLLAAYTSGMPGTDYWRAFDAMQCAALLRETTWGMISAIHLNAPGVDYDEYTAENLHRYKQALDRYQTRYGKLT